MIYLLPQKSVNIMSHYHVKILRMTSGERLPLLIESLSGQPVYETVIFTISELRSQNLASNTIEQYLRAIKIFLMFLDSRDIDFTERLRSGAILNLSELDELCYLCRFPVKIIENMLLEKKTGSVVRSLDRHKLKVGMKTCDEVETYTVSIRMLRIKEYIEKSIDRVLQRNDLDVSTYSLLSSRRVVFLRSFKTRIPVKRERGYVNKREGLSRELREYLLDVIDADSKYNPWVSQFVRKRNELMILFLYYLGLRKGELLNLKITDFDFRKNEVWIMRRADDIEDPRINQPKVKTMARKLPMQDELAQKAKEYIYNERSKITGARKHQFLFVSDRKGQPLTIPALDKVFFVLRENTKKIPDNFSAHVLRHTWNDKFSEDMEKRKVKEKDEKNLRSYIMGWSPTSGTAAIYTKRYVREKANEILLGMQKEMRKDFKDGN